MRKQLELKDLKPRWDMEESGSWMWMLRERFDNARDNEIHADLSHQDFTKKTTRAEIVQFYERLYSALLEHTKTLDSQLREALARANSKETHIRLVEEQRDEAVDAWERHKARFEVLMKILTEAHETEVEPW